MVEPLAQIVKGSISRHPVISSVARTVSNSKRKPLLNNFFTPVPRQTCAPESSELVSNGMEPVAQCQAWSCCAVRHSLTCPKREHSWNFDMGATASSNRRRGRSRPHMRSSDLNHQSMHSPRLSKSLTAQGQRRHASMATETIAPATSALPAEALLETSDVLQTEIPVFMQYCATKRTPGNLNKAWAAYTALSDAGLLGEITTTNIMYFVENMLIGVDVALGTKGKMQASVVQEWAQRIRSILDDLLPRLKSDSALHSPAQIFAARCSALAGDYGPLTTLIHDKAAQASAEDPEVLELYHNLLLAMSTSQRPSYLLDYLVQEWEPLTKSLLSASPHSDHGARRPLRKFIVDLVLNVEHPTQMVTKAKVADRKQLLDLFLQVYIDHHAFQKASDLICEAHQRSIAIPVSLLMSVAAELGKAEENKSAREVLACNPNRDHDYYSMALLLASKMGDVEEAESAYASITDVALRTPRNQQMVLLAYANSGDIEGLERRFNDFFPKDEKGIRIGAGRDHYAAIFLGLAKHRRGEGIEAYLEEFNLSGLEPHNRIYAIILQCYAQHDQVEALISIYDHMKERGWKPDEVVYTIGIAYFARRRDQITAEVLYKRAIEEGLKPNLYMLVSLMNAHVEAATWTGVVKVYDYMKALYGGESLPIGVHNNLLKAYVRMGAPFRVLARHFSRLKSLGVEPDPYTYVVMAQAACDGGQWPYANAVYEDCLKQDKQDPSAGFVSPQLLTVLFDGYHRTGQTERMIKLYDEMVKRGQGSSKAYGAIINHYARLKTPEGLKVAEEFVDAIRSSDPNDDSWKSLPNGQNPWYEQIYRPLMNHYSHVSSLGDVQRLYQEVIDRGGTPTIQLHTQLLDCYRRKSDIEGVLRTWPQIFQMGLEHINAGASLSAGETIPSSQYVQSDILSNSFSIYIDALSTAGMHAEIDEACKVYQESGFALTVHNWNHLAFAAIRAGLPERAFEIFQNVILAHQVAAKNYNPVLEQNPASPLLFEDGTLPSQFDINSPASNRLSRPAFRTGQTRQRTARQSGPSLAQYYSGLQPEDEDISQPLRKLLKITPEPVSWRAHRVLLEVLLLVICRLQNGYPVIPLEPGGKRVPATGAFDTQAARRTLKRIVNSYPQAFEKVTQFKKAEINRLGERYAYQYERR